MQDLMQAVGKVTDGSPIPEGWQPVWNSEEGTTFYLKTFRPGRAKSVPIVVTLEEGVRAVVGALSGADARSRLARNLYSLTFAPILVPQEDGELGPSTSDVLQPWMSAQIYDWAACWNALRARDRMMKAAEPELARRALARAEQGVVDRVEAIAARLESVAREVRLQKDKVSGVTDLTTGLLRGPAVVAEAIQRDVIWMVANLDLSGLTRAAAEVEVQRAKVAALSGK